MILPNITVPLPDHCLSVNVDIEILMEEPTTVHPDNPIKGKEESRAITNINWVEFLLLGKRGCTVLRKDYLGLEATLEQLVLNELESKTIIEIQNM